MNGRPSSFLARWGALVARHPWRVLAVWLLIVAMALPLASALPGRLIRTGGPVPGSQAVEVRELLAAEFDNPFVEPLIMVVGAERVRLGEAPVDDAVKRLAAALRGLPDVARVGSPLDAEADKRLRSPDGKTFVLLIGPRTGAAAAAETLMAVRRVAAPFEAELTRLDPGLRLATTGAIAMANDVIARNAEDTKRAELLVLGPALLLLFAVFASPVAAAMPLVLGLLASVVALGLAALVALVIPLNSYVQTAVTMLGLALGIDYSLLVVWRFRQERRAGRDVPSALAATLGAAGWTVACSGLVVVLALAVLVTSGLTEPVSVGVGGALVVGAAAALALTLLPALLALTDRWLDRPRGLAERLGAIGSAIPWDGWARWLHRHRFAAAALALVVLVVLALPAARFQGGFPDGRWLPSGVEAVEGLELLHRMEGEGLSYPVMLVVRAPEGERALQPRTLFAMRELSQRLKADPRVATVFSPVDLRSDLTWLHYLALYAKPEAALARYPAIAEFLLSHDRSAALMQVVLKDGVPFSQAKALVTELRADAPKSGTLLVGGVAAVSLDFDARLRAFIPMAVAFVLGSTALVLFVAFRSVLVPLKAIALNALAVGASMGLCVLVFQEGWGAGLIGLEAPISSMPLNIPLMLFCLTFGLSMDYEIFLVSRVREERARAGDAEAIARGLSATGGVITAAAAIMVLVFGAFVGVDMVLVKLLGFGLATAILIDATLIRGVLAPATLAIAGRWNWWPGEAPGSELEQEPAQPTLPRVG